MTRGPAPGNPWGHRTRCRCSDQCRTYANADAARYRDELRAQGYVFRRGRVRRPSPRRPHDYDAVARVATEAIESGLSPAQAVAGLLGISSPAAADVIYRARSHGHYIPRARLGRPPRQGGRR